MKTILATILAAGLTLAAFAQSVSTIGVSINPTNFTVKGSSTNFHLSNADRGVATVDTIDKLAMTTNGQHGAVVFVRGRLEANDWIAPKPFVLRTNSVAETNDIVIANAGGSGRWEHPWEGDVSAFGVKADGVTDDTASVNSVFNYVLNSDSEVETVVFPAGTVIHSGITLTPTKNKLLRILGSSANSATAVEPFGSRLLLKSGSTNVLFSIQLSSSFRLRLDVHGVYFDGNRDNCPDASDVLRITGDGSSYLSAGSWQDCAFNRGNRHGVLLTNVVYQFKATRVNCQSNRDTGLWTDRGGDHHFTSFLSEKSGGNGVYHYITENSTYQDSDIAFNGGNGVFLQDCRKMRFVNCDLSVAGKSSVVLAGDSSNNMFYGGFVNCRIGSANSSLSGVPTTYASGTYSTVTLSGTSGSHWGHVFENCMMLAFEASDTTKPKHVFEDLRSNIQWTTYPGAGIALIGCAISTATNYTTSGRFSSGFEDNANLFAISDHGGSYGMTNSIPNLIIKRTLLGQGVSTFGSPTNQFPAIIAQGGSNAQSVIEFSRPQIPTTFGVRLGTDQLSLYSNERALNTLVTFYDGSKPVIMAGGRSLTTPTGGSFAVAGASGGTDVTGGDMVMDAGPGTGAQTLGGAITFRTPDITGSGTTVQSLTTKLRIERDGRLSLYNGLTSDPSSSISRGQVYFNDTIKKFRALELSSWQTVQTASHSSNSIAWDPPSIPAGGAVTTNITMVGATPTASGPPIVDFDRGTNAVLAQATVSATNQVTVILFNPTGSSVDPGSANIRIIVPNL